MATTGLCRYDAYVVVAAQLDSNGEFSVDVCDDAATHRAIVRRDGDGLTVAVDVDVCLTHDLILSTAPGWRTSKKIRRTST